jgi:hypothetical protein
MKTSTEEIGDAVQELRDAMIENIKIKSDEDSIAIARIAARARLLRAKENLRALELN